MRAPQVLEKRGRQIWKSLSEKYEFDDHEREVLLEFCRVLDRIDSLSGRVDSDGVMIAGSQGQQVLHPAVAEIRQQQQAAGRLLTQLNLPDAEGDVALSRQISSQAQAAANARWQRSKRARGGAA